MQASRTEQKRRAYSALKRVGLNHRLHTMPAVLNAANEVAVAAFLDHRCTLPAIAAVVDAVLDTWITRNHPLATLEQALAADDEAGLLAEGLIGKYQSTKIRSEKRC